MKYLLATIALFLAAPAFADHQYPNAIKSCDKPSFWFMPQCESADRVERTLPERPVREREPQPCEYCEQESATSRAVVRR